MHKPSLKKYYEETVVAELGKDKRYKNRHQIPVIEKIVVNTGFDAAADKAWIKDAVRDVSLITGQQPVTTKARESISNFKLRQGMINGAKVTLRGNQMYDFLLRFISVALPNVRDFRGVSRKLDGSGNYNIGVVDHSIFPEISVEGNKNNLGMDITIVTSAKTDEEARELLRLMGMPFHKPTSSKSS